MYFFSVFLNIKKSLEYGMIIYILFISQLEFGHFFLFKRILGSLNINNLAVGLHLFISSYFDLNNSEFILLSYSVKHIGCSFLFHIYNSYILIYFPFYIITDVVFF